MRLYVGNLRWEMSEAEIEAEFSKFGAVADVYLPRTKDGQPRGIGFVTMRDTAAGEKVLQAGAIRYLVRTIYVRAAWAR